MVRRHQLPHRDVLIIKVRGRAGGRRTLCCVEQQTPVKVVSTTVTPSFLLAHTAWFFNIL